MWVIAVVMVLGGALQLWAGVRAHRRKGDFQTTQARQLSSVLGPTGTVAFFFVVGIALTLGGLAIIVSLLRA